jgi:1-deoxy-D-xylulose-5-phosphate synthase
MPEGTGLGPFSEKFPDRFYDVGIAEAHGVTFAAGMATEGYKPVVAIYSTFLQRAYDQIIHDVCLESLPVVFAVDRGGIVGEDGPTHHGLFDLSYLRAIANMVVMAPMDEHELQRMLVTAVNHPGPVAVRYPRGKVTGENPEKAEKNDQPLAIGRAEVLCSGDDILILAIGHSVTDAVKARQMLADKGIFATVVNARFVKPLDTELIGGLIQKIPRVITVEENVLDGGFGSAVLEAMADAGVTGFRITRIGIKDTFVTHGAKSVLRKHYEVDADAVVRAAEAMCRDLA